MMFYYVTLSTPLGWIGTLKNSVGLRKTTLPQKTENLALEVLLGKEITASYSRQIFEDVLEFYNLYFSGKKSFFSGNLDFSGFSPFQTSVWKTTFQIPFGETRSYAWIAGEIQNPGSCRAVGNALNQNPLPIIVPCHRVIASNGKLGGFRGGQMIKINLLKLENSSLVF